MITFLTIVGLFSLWLIPFGLLLFVASKVYEDSNLGSNTITAVAFLYFFGYLMLMVVFAES